MLRVGIVGLPNIGKSTLFNALTKQGAEVANFPFTTIEPNVGVVPVPDDRLPEIARIFKSAKTTPTTIEFVDIAGLIKGAHQGEGLGNEFLSHIREVDAIVHVVRFFTDPNVPHTHNKIDPLDDVAIVNTELELADAQLLERSQKKDEDYNLPLLKNKPTLYVANLSEQQIQNTANSPKLTAFTSKYSPVLPISVKIEQELTELPPEDRSTFLAEYGLNATGLDRLIHASYQLLNLITFFTANQNEAHAWTLKQGSTAPPSCSQSAHRHGRRIYSGRNCQLSRSRRRQHLCHRSRRRESSR